jgi:RNA-directed DNA polymerase
LRRPQIERERDDSLRLSLFDQPNIRKGLPIGNLTSQLFANIFMNEFDQFVKHQLIIKHYIRYTDDFVIISTDKLYLEDLIPKLQEFLKENLKLEIHPSKISVRKARQGIDFLGYVVLPRYRLLRARTKRRILRKINLDNSSSYLGLLNHCSGYNLKRKAMLISRLNKKPEGLRRSRIH